MDKGLLDDHAPAEEERIPEVTVHAKGIQLIWILPLVAAIIGAWLVFKTYSEQGPEIVITFKTAEGIVAGKTRIKHKDVEIGRVTTVALGPGFMHVDVHAQLAKGTEPYLTGNTLFWVVRPRLSLHGISGLSTLMAGPHIEIEPGKGAPKRKFKGRETPPVVRVDAAGAKFTLKAESLGSLDAGSPVYYRDINAGEVLGFELTEDKKGVDVHVFIRNPFHWLVQENSRFWKVSGIDVSIGSEGIKVKTASMQTLLLGGVTFDTPTTFKSNKPAASGTVFQLYASENAITEQSYTKKIVFVLYFDGSVRGLSVGAPVEFRGIKVGKVTDIRLEYDVLKTVFRIPVLIQIEPERVISISKNEVITDDSPYALLTKLVEQGLRARLQTGSYLTGQLFIDLDLHPESPMKLVGDPGKFSELPTIPTSLDEITASVTHLLKKLQAVPIDEIGKELSETLKGVNKTVNAPEVLDSVRALKASVEGLKTLMKSLNQQVDPLAVSFQGTSAAAHKALDQMRVTLASANKVIKPKSPLHYRLLEVTRELTETARVIRSFVQMLENKPESLLFGRGK